MKFQLTRVTDGLPRIFALSNLAFGDITAKGIQNFG